ncbi:MAG: hypothetical protein HQK54_05795 [Oligoflexales bacterium]|nr:hypothetical protein [Oligoflexales bacterium]
MYQKKRSLGSGKPGFIKVIMLLTLFCAGQAGCTKEKKSTDKKNVEFVVSENGENSTAFSLDVSKSNDHVIVRPIRIPEGKIKISNCLINGQMEKDCLNGISLKASNPGIYNVIFSIEFEDRFPVTSEVRFQIKNGELISITKPSEGSSRHPKLTLAGDSINFKQGSNVDKTKPLEFKFYLSASTVCKARYLCSRTANIWSLCNKNNLPEISLSPREIIDGFQHISIKAICEESDTLSDTLDLSFYGVKPDYLLLALKKRNIGNFFHYGLIRENDCRGKLRYLCKNSSSKTFEACPNIKVDPPSGFQIRAHCEKDGEATDGPSIM